MNTTLPAFHILVWRAMAMGVPVLLCVALARDMRAARRQCTGLA